MVTGIRCSRFFSNTSFICTHFSLFVHLPSPPSNVSHNSKAANDRRFFYLFIVLKCLPSCHKRRLSDWVGVWDPRASKSYRTQYGNTVWVPLNAQKRIRSRTSVFDSKPIRCFLSISLSLRLTSAECRLRVTHLYEIIYLRRSLAKIVRVGGRLYDDIAVVAAIVRHMVTRCEWEADESWELTRPPSIRNGLRPQTAHIHSSVHPHTGAYMLPVINSFYVPRVCGTIGIWFQHKSCK